MSDERKDFTDEPNYGFSFASAKDDEHYYFRANLTFGLIHVALGVCLVALLIVLFRYYF